MYRLRQVLEVLRDHKLYAKFIKYHFWNKEVRFLGYIMLLASISVDPDKVVVVMEWKWPTTLPNEHSFLGLVMLAFFLNWYLYNKPLAS